MQKKNCFLLFLGMIMFCLFLSMPIQKAYAEANEWVDITIYKGDAVQVIVKNDNILLSEWILLRDGQEINTINRKDKLPKDKKITNFKLPDVIMNNMEIGDIVSVKIEKTDEYGYPIESEEPKNLEIKVNGLKLILYHDEMALNNKEPMDIQYLGKGDKTTLPIIEKEGYILKGWKNTRSGRIYPAGEEWEQGYNIYELIFVGLWEVDENFQKDPEENPNEEQPGEEEDLKPDDGFQEDPGKKPEDKPQEKPEKKPDDKPKQKPIKDYIEKKKPIIKQLTFPLNNDTGTILGAEEILKDIDQVKVEKTNHSYKITLHNRNGEEMKPNEWIWLDFPVSGDVTTTQYRAFVNSKETIFEKRPETGSIRFALRFSDEEIEYKTIQNNQIKVHGTIWALNGAEELIIKKNKTKQEYFLADKDGNIISTRGPVWIEMPKQQAERILVDGIPHSFIKENTTIKIPVDF